MGVLIISVSKLDAHYYRTVAEAVTDLVLGLYLLLCRCLCCTGVRLCARSTACCWVSMSC
jgi:hypothetical protein